MQDLDTPLSDWPSRIRRAAPVIIPLLVLVALAALIWRLSTDKAGIRREAPQVSVVALMPPPPPPPPPPKERPPEPDRTVETPVAAPKAEAPKPDAAPKQLTIPGPPQTADSFGVAAGKGDGLTVGGDPNGSDTPGGGFGAGAYGRYITGVLQRAAQADGRLSRSVFSAQVQLWIAPDGVITKVVLTKSSGETGLDQVLVATLRGVGRFDEAPPADLKFPARVVLNGRRS